MKKYSKLVVLVVIVFVMFSYYYVQAGTLSDTFEQFNIKTIEGDESLLDDVVIKGDYYGGNYVDQSFKVSKDGTDYLRDASYFDRLEDYYISDKVKKLRKENRQFMRMKNSEESSYLEHENTIIYASVPYTRWGVFKGYLQLETYNRETKERNIAKIDTTNLLDYSMIEKMFVHDDELYILVLNMEYDLATETEKTVLSIYAYNLSDETVTNTYEVALDERDYYSDFTNVFVDNEANPTEIMITGAAVDYEEINMTTEEATVVEGFSDDEEDFREIVQLTGVKKVNLQTGKITEINVKNVVENAVPIAYNGSEIVFVALKGNQLLYYTYDVAKKTIAEKLTVDTDATYISMWDFQMNIVKDNKVYTLINHDATSTATLLIVDTLTGELLYKGLVEGDLGEPVIQDETEIYFHTLELLPN